MNESKELILTNNSIWGNFKRWIKNIFKNKEKTEIVEECKEVNNELTTETNTSFKQSISVQNNSVVENSEEKELLKLQKYYRNGKIKEEELSQEQIKALCDLYDRQITNLKKSNESRKKKLLEYKRKLQTNN